MMLTLALLVTALVFILLPIIWKVWLPEYAFNFVLARKEPETARKVLANYFPIKDGEPVPQPVPWIDTVDREIAEIISYDGLKLRAYFTAVPAENADTVILAHGYTGNGKQLSDWAKFYYEDFGFSVLMPDARAHGSSEGRYIGFGGPDRLDYLRWIDWVRERRPQTRIVLHGISMGGATVMMTAGETHRLPPEVRAVIDDCGYSSMEEELRHQMKLRYRFVSDSLIKATSRVCRRKAGYSFEEVSCVEQVRKSRLPFLIIHGEEDGFVPFSMAKILFDAAPPADQVWKEFYPVSGADHGGAYSANPEMYKNRIAQFLKKVFNEDTLAGRH
ncbi:MAG: alpha/beta hydrolase [Treponema sp.]|nr:alpha/beta hydrolase [Treponema sp.]